MQNLIDAHLLKLSEIDKFECWYLVKQDTVFWKQCYYVSILEKWSKTTDNQVNLETFFRNEIQELNSKNPYLKLSETYRALRIAFYYGLIYSQDLTYNKSETTSVYQEIVKRTEGKFENTELYSDIILSQLEKIFVSSDLDEKKQDLRKEFNIFPCLFLYKILLEIGKSTGDYKISFDEYRYFISVQKEYADFWDTLVLIRESRENENFIKQFYQYKSKLDSRFNLIFNQLETLNIDDKYYSIKPEKLDYVRDIIFLYEKRGIQFNNYLNFLTSTQTISSAVNNNVELIEPSITNEVEMLNTIQLSKPFLLLAGISGTGKTRFVREQVLRTGSLSENYCLVSVRPDWHEPSDLLGYVSRLSGKAEYVATDVLRFLVRAWQNLSEFATFNEKTGEVILSIEHFIRLKPYWLCLDEMNLAPVEQYFADYLSVLETRSLKEHEGKIIYQCDPIIKANTLADSGNILDKLEVENPTLREFFMQYGISIPFNLIVAGTVNMDETTHGFSRKVLDRALSFDFSEFFPNQFNEFFNPKTQPKIFTFPRWTDASCAVNQSDNNVQDSIVFLEKVNKVLNDSSFKLAYRALNELLLSVKCFSPRNSLELQSVWDDFLMIKVLPRLEGDEDKIGSILDDLESILSTELTEIWDQENRIDLFRENIDGSKIGGLPCYSQKKILEMKKRLERTRFTHFWQ